MPLTLPKPPRLLLAPAQRLSGEALVAILNRSLRALIRDGELDFLAGRCVAIGADDLGLSWRLTLDGDRIRLSPAEPDVTIDGKVPDLILMASRREDPDTLFFQRRLRIEGDTELGLWVKNLMDRLELDDLPAPVRLAVTMAGAALSRQGQTVQSA